MLGDDPTARPQMSRPAPSHLVAVSLGIGVTFLWATSWVLIKQGLTEEAIGPIGFAGLRYATAAVILLALALPRLVRVQVWHTERPTLVRAVALGVVLYGVAQAAQFIAIDELPAATVGLFIATAPAWTAVLALRGRHETASALQIIGIVILIAGVVTYFGLSVPPEDAWAGMLAAVVVTAAVAGSARLGRTLAVDSGRAFGGVLGLTAIAMAAGAMVTLIAAVVLEGVPTLTPVAMIYVGWLAIVNTAFAFTAWNFTLRTLTAVESSALADLTVIQIAILAWVFLGESLGTLEMVGLALALLGVLLVQVAPWLKRRGSWSGPIPSD